MKAGPSSAVSNARRQRHLRSCAEVCRGGRDALSYPPYGTGPQDAGGTRPWTCQPALCSHGCSGSARRSHNAGGEHRRAALLRERWAEAAPPAPGVPATPGSVPARRRHHLPARSCSRRVRGGAGDAGGAAAPGFRFPRWPPRAGSAPLPSLPGRAPPPRRHAAGKLRVARPPAPAASPCAASTY